MKTESGCALFETTIGECAISWRGDRVTCIQLPEVTRERTLERLRSRAGTVAVASPPRWVKAATRTIARHLEGSSQDFDRIPLDLDALPPFHRKVYEAARTVGPATTVTYGELAVLAGSPRAFRAVGQALAKNRFPIVVPCHRIVGAGGKPGGFSAFGCLETKARLLEIEGARLERASDLPFDWAKAKRHLRRQDAVLGRAIEKAPPLQLEVQAISSPFDSLLRAIVYQQLNGKAAGTILARVEAALGGEATPRAIVATSDEALRGAGLSRAKLAAARDLAAKTLDGTVPTLDEIRTMDEDTIIERLTEIRGIGRWTVEMLLIFGLGRPDVLPATDYGVRKGFQRAFRMRDLPTPSQVLERGERWRPYRTAAAWYLWRATEI
jgi:methylated-DNA-[protein]-cysteine S-methyltransferase